MYLAKKHKELTVLSEPDLPRWCVAWCHSGWEAAVVHKALASTVEVQDVVGEGRGRGFEVQVARANTGRGLGG